MVSHLHSQSGLSSMGLRAEHHRWRSGGAGGRGGLGGL